MSDRCPRCGLDEEGRGIMCPSADAAPLTWTMVARFYAATLLIVFSIILLARYL
jgi:hypothetical protein